MKTKRVLCSLILVVMCFVLTGCVNIEYQRRVDDKGRILDKVTIELDYQKLTDKGYDDTQILELLNNIKDDLHQNYIRPIELRLEEIREQDAVLYNKVMAGLTLNPVVRDVERYKVSAEVLYDSGDIMEIIYNTQSDDESEELETRVEPFLTKYVQTSENVFGDITSLTINGNNFYEEYMADYPGFTNDDIKLTQIYGSTNYRLKTNADTSQMVEDYMCHLWELDVNEAKTFNLEFYYLSPTASSWYILALALAGATACALVAVYLIKKNKKAQKSTNEMGETKENE